MPDLTVPLVLVGLVLLLLLGQWIVVRRARSVRGQPVPAALWPACAPQGESADQPVLLVFEAEHCMACRRMAPAVASLRAEFEGRVCVLPVAEHRALAMSLRIMATPTVVLVADQRVIEVFVGITPREVIGKALQRSLGESGAIA